ncbi:MAG: leucine-rich repeat domain-containing protein [Mycoplasmoidaceae bacterium]|nr:leucine-rich repeat domain-containing protein [Mycoplasmoidaceae bacterium]
MRLSKIALFSCIAAPVCITPQIITSAILDSFNNADNDEIPEQFYKIENGKLLGFKDNIKQSDIYTGHYTIMNIPSNVTEIGDYAFAYMFDGISCDVSTLIIPQQLHKIGNYSFFRCSGLTEIVFRSIGGEVCRLQSVGAHCFEYCSFTGDLVLPDLLTEVGDRAFYNCKSLDQKLVLPSSLETVGDFAFASCTNVRTIDLTKYEDVPI